MFVHIFSVEVSFSHLTNALQTLTGNIYIIYQRDLYYLLVHIDSVYVTIIMNYKVWIFE